MSENKFKAEHFIKVNTKDGSVYYEKTDMTFEDAKGTVKIGEKRFKTVTTDMSLDEIDSVSFVEVFE